MFYGPMVGKNGPFSERRVAAGSLSIRFRRNGEWLLRKSGVVADVWGKVTIALENAFPFRMQTCFCIVIDGKSWWAKDSESPAPGGPVCF
jgi:hypothetical protein